MPSLRTRTIMQRIACALVAATAVLQTSTAFAQEVTLNRQQRNLVIVWNDKFDYQRGQRLIADGAPFDLQQAFMACTVDPRTKAYIVDNGGYFQTVVVAEGRSKGCQGVVSRGDIEG